MELQRLTIAIALMACGLAACGTAHDRFAGAKDATRVTKPLVEWVELKPEHLAEVNPDRLKGEGAALLVARSIQETPSGDRRGASHVLTLRDVSTSSIRSAQVQRTGTDAEVGWGVLIVPPGQYAVNRGHVRRTLTERVNEAKETFVDTRGHPYVPLTSTIRVNAGDVAYVGTVVWRQQTSGPVKPFIRDERAAATRWAEANIPEFSRHMQTRLLPTPVQPLSQ